ncbi:unnamed protein product [Effrenium voratum]|uniref:Uncharacterized protein n=1 Tax=Effrenium voratum TaxID=2562239 RepID=A0AA36IT81_9DINO|nr:unnamed protein product [Effrenium voratum]CAJ1434711.1 unnamed protein product [Effrenium voratum]
MVGRMALPSKVNLDSIGEDSDSVWDSSTDAGDEISVLSRGYTGESCFITHVDVIIAVPEIVSRMAFETYVARACLDEPVQALDETELAEALAVALEGDPDVPLMILIGEDWYLDEILKLPHLQKRKPFLAAASGNALQGSHCQLPASCGQAAFHAALSQCVSWSLSQ